MCDCVVGEGSLKWGGCRKRYKQGLMLFTFSFKCPLCSLPPITWHLVTVYSSGLPPTLQSHHHQDTHTQSCTQTHTMGRLLSPLSVQEASPLDLSWLKRAQIMMLAWPAWASCWPSNPHQYKPLILHKFPVINWHYHYQCSEHWNRKYGHTDWIGFANVFHWKSCIIRD